MLRSINYIKQSVPVLNEYFIVDLIVRKFKIR